MTVSAPFTIDRSIPSTVLQAFLNCCILDDTGSNLGRGNKSREKSSEGVTISRNDHQGHVEGTLQVW